VGPTSTTAYKELSFREVVGLLHLKQVFLFFTEL
jgi:hypothetical protein